MTENAIAPAESREIFDPRTGEVVDLVQTDEDWLGEFLTWVRDLETQARDAKRLVSIEVHRRMDADASWTRTGSRHRLKGQSPPSPDYDADRLREALDLLVEDGKITAEAKKAALEEVVTYKPRKRGIQAILKLGGDVAELVAEAEKPKDPDARRVSVEAIPER